MKQYGRLFAKLVACGVAFVAATVVSTTQAAQGTAKVQVIRNGSAEFTEDGSTWKKLSVGTVLKAGSTVKTDASAVVDLFLKANGPVVRVTPGSSLELTTLTFDQADGETVITTELGLSSGRILGSVKKLAAASKYDVKTPVGTCGIRGTKYDISAAGRVLVVEGTVVVRYTVNGVQTTFVVQVNQVFDPTANNGQGAVTDVDPVEARRLLDEINSIVITQPGGIAEVQIRAVPKDNEPTEPTSPSEPSSHQEGPR
jgi:hypothetical protein